MSEEVNVFDEDEMAEYFYKKLILNGFACTKAESKALGSIMFDFLIEEGFIEEIVIDDDDEWEDDYWEED